MQRDIAPYALPSLDDIAAAAGLDAEQNDLDGRFPAAAFAALHAMGVAGPTTLKAGEAKSLLWMLAAVGRGDLSVGRILEGHLNVLFLIERYGSAQQYLRHCALARSGALYGVWNTDAPADPLLERDGVLHGSKSFATGVDGLSHAVVTARNAGARRMFLVPLDGRPVDRAWWRPMGMKASGSHIVDFSGLKLHPRWALGGPDAYIEQPWFSAGAMRFAAVQVGGMHAVLDLAVDHLRKAGRASDPYQRHRLGDMGAQVETGYGWLRRCADSWTQAELGGADTSAELIATVSGARGAIERCCLNVLELAERGVGAAGLIAPHPLERRIRDLRTYLRQPNPDGALAHFGQSIVDGHWGPGWAPK